MRGTKRHAPRDQVGTSHPNHQRVFQELQRETATSHLGNEQWRVTRAAHKGATSEAGSAVLSEQQLFLLFGKPKGLSCSERITASSLHARILMAQNLWWCRTKQSLCSGLLAEWWTPPRAVLTSPFQFLLWVFWDSLNYTNSTRVPCAITCFAQSRVQEESHPPKLLGTERGICFARRSTNATSTSISGSLQSYQPAAPLNPAKFKPGQRALESEF